MEIGNLEGLTRVLQASISPVALISGVGLLILSQSNRFGRVMDRLREMLREGSLGAVSAPLVQSQIRILHRRAEILRMSIACAVGCVLLVSVLILCLFAIAILDLRVHRLVVLLFALSLLCLIASLAFFLWDMHLSLQAMHEEVRRRERKAD